MKNIFKSLFVVILGIFCTYVVWALCCFLFTGEWLGAVSINEGGVVFVIATIIVTISMFAYLSDKTNYYS